jgi:c(7)-type cytochrome triheme protein
MCSTQKRKTSRGVVIVAMLCGLLMLATPALAQQVFLNEAPPEQDLGNVMLNQHATADTGPVLFEHWLHRSKFTCRLCHVDLGFTMRTNATGVDAATNQQGFYCGACHDGHRQFDGVTLFRACVTGRSAKNDEECARCHISSKTTRKYSYRQWTAKFPKSGYGANWMAAEQAGIIKPADLLEGVSISKPRLENRQELAIKPKIEWFTGVHFSHEMHTVWNGCEVCHPEIFPTQSNGPLHISMYQIAAGRFCGCCHGKVAFPVNSCGQCHAHGPSWVSGPGWIF